MVTVYSKGTNQLFVFWMPFCTTLFLAPRAFFHLPEICPKTQYYFMNLWERTTRPQQRRSGWAALEVVHRCRYLRHFSGDRSWIFLRGIYRYATGSYRYRYLHFTIPRQPYLNLQSPNLTCT